jgi:hypothetical protein
VREDGLCGRDSCRGPEHTQQGLGSSGSSKQCAACATGRAPGVALWRLGVCAAGRCARLLTAAYFCAHGRRLQTVAHLQSLNVRQGVTAIDGSLRVWRRFCVPTAHEAPALAPVLSLLGWPIGSRRAACCVVCP